MRPSRAGRARYKVTSHSGRWDAENLRPSDRSQASRGAVPRPRHSRSARPGRSASDQAETRSARYSRFLSSPTPSVSSPEKRSAPPTNAR